MRGKAKKRFGVQCNQHGVESKLWAGRVVLVSEPKNTRQRFSGCPLCNAEKRRSDSEAA